MYGYTTRYSGYKTMHACVRSMLEEKIEEISDTISFIAPPELTDTKKKHTMS